jgi:hypothetical protein
MFDTQTGTNLARFRCPGGGYTPDVRILLELCQKLNPPRSVASRRPISGPAGVVAVGTPVARRPPRRSVRAAFLHTV